MRRGDLVRQRLIIRIASNRIFVVALAGVLGSIFAYNSARTVQDNQYKMRALAIAKATSAIPGLGAMLEAHDPKHQIRVIAETLRKNTDASYVVIADVHGIRFSHPNPALIGKKLDGKLLALTGKSYTTIDNGTLGRSVNGKSPIYDSAGKIAGLVSAGILQSKLHDEGKYLLRSFLFFGVGFIFAGLLLSELFVRFARNRKLALELEEVTTQFQEREAMLHAIREGVMTLNSENKITLINDEALKLLELEPTVIGKKVVDVVLPGRLRQLLVGEVESDDDLRVLTDKFSIIINRRLVSEKNKVIGAVVTLRDRTEHIELLRELESVQNFTEALRSQQHEFANRLHTINGLLELKKYEEASEFLGEIALAQTTLAEDLRSKLGNSLITALLIAKVAIAREKGVKLEITAATSLDDLNIDPNALVTIVGNLIDNAIDAASGSPRGEVTVVFKKGDESHKSIRVHDSGPGLPEDNAAIVFEDGFTTKNSRGAGHRGLGLAIVQRLIRQHSGTIIASNESGATFLVELPVVAFEMVGGKSD